MMEGKEEQHDVAPWDSDIMIPYAIPFRDVKPVIRLGEDLFANR